MKKIQKTVELDQYSRDELSEEYVNLWNKAEEALADSYSPYSQFPVGAAILLEDGTMLKGANQENAAYPSGLCAERAALFAYGSNYKEKKIKALAVTISKPIDTFAFPCGACLQVMSEYEQRQEELYDILIIHPKEDKLLISKGIYNLLPFGFKKENLG